MCIEAYAGGLLDGEGSILVNPNRKHQLQVVFSMCDPEPLDALAAKWKGSNVTEHGPTYTGRTIYRWTISGERAIQFLRNIQPWVYNKTRQVTIALGYPLYGKGRGGLPETVSEERRLVGAQLQLARMGRR